MTDGAAPNPTASAGRVVALDGLRGVAAMWVVLYHFTDSYAETYGDELSPVRVRNGPFAVYLFFMISGFVILMTLDRSKRVIDFTVARIARLYPAYWTGATLAFLIGVSAPWFAHKVSFGTYLVNLTMIQKAFGVDNVDGVYWSLRIELTFYAVLAVIVALGLRSRLVAMLGAVVLFSVIERAVGLFDATPGLRGALLLDYMHMFLFGILMYDARGGWRWPHVVLCILCVAAGSLDRAPYYVALVLPMFLVMFLATHARVPLLASRPFVILGGLTYSVYLVHAPLGFVIIHALRSAGVAGVPTVIVACAGALLAGFALNRWVEIPGNRLLRGWMTREPRTAKAAD